MTTDSPRLCRYAASFLVGVAASLALGGHVAASVIAGLLAGALAFTALLGAMRKEHRP